MSLEWWQDNVRDQSVNSLRMIPGMFEDCLPIAHGLVSLDCHHYTHRPPPIPSHVWTVSKLSRTVCNQAVETRALYSISLILLWTVWDHFRIVHIIPKQCPDCPTMVLGYGVHLRCPKYRNWILFFCGDDFDFLSAGHILAYKSPENPQTVCGFNKYTIPPNNFPTPTNIIRRDSCDM